MNAERTYQMKIKHGIDISPHIIISFTDYSRALEN